MQARTTGAIATKPTGNAQGGFWFYSLTTGRMLGRRRWTPLPMPQDVIERITVLARTNPAGMRFTNMRNEPVYDFDDGSDDDSDYDPDEEEDDDDDYDNFIAGVEVPHAYPPDPPDENESDDEHQPNQQDDDEEKEDNVPVGELTGDLSDDNDSDNNDSDEDEENDRNDEPDRDEGDSEIEDNDGSEEEEQAEAETPAISASLRKLRDTLGALPTILETRTRRHRAKPWLQEQTK
jgi:hypothetical protein